MAAPTINKLLTPYNFTDKNAMSRIKYIVIHYVGALGGAKANCQYYASKYLGASAHYFVGFEGEIWQSVEDADIAWHCGAKNYKHAECRNSNSIGIEMCVRNKGSQADTSKDWYFEQATVDKAIELTKYLMAKYNVPADHVIRHYDVTGKICPNPYVYNTTQHTWDAFKKAIASDSTDTSSMTKITGKAQATAAQMTSYIKEKNPKVAQSVIDMIPLYISEGKAENIRGDIAFAQSCLETGNFGFSGSAVTLDQNNFCGMGVTENGMKGNSFDTPQLGIRAQIQHLKAYANTAALKQECVDPRFSYVTRGCAAYVEYLGIQENPKGKGWASGANYGEKILTILKNILAIGAKKDEKETEKSSESSSGETNSSFPEVPFTVKVIVDDLNIRTSPSSKDDSNLTGKQTGKNTFTITEVSGSWGKLKSGAGWISLTYTKKVS